jgi:hypothetical protein
LTIFPSRFAALFGLPQHIVKSKINYPGEVNDWLL